MRKEIKEKLEERNEKGKWRYKSSETGEGGKKREIIEKEKSREKGMK